DKNHQEKVRQMILHVDDFDYIVTDSEFEALVLENSLIKQHQPKYNILLKDDKGYSYIKITPGPWPKISECKQILKDGAKY
ncbi:MAG: excinuclease ABC subunit UvrC, partial [Oscillospiraceae bacterium]